MKNSIFAQSLMARKISTLIWAGSMTIFALMYAALFNSFSSQIGNLTSNTPDSFNAVFSLSQAGDPAGWLGIELYGLFLPIILAIVGVSFGASAIGKEEESGTLELLLASPISRAKILAQKALAIAATLAAIATAVWAGVALGTLFFEFDISLIHVFWASLSAWLLGLTFGFFTLAVQQFGGKRGLAIGAGAAAVGLTYFIDVISKLIDKLDFLKHLSLFYYNSYEDFLYGNLRFAHLFVLASLVIIFYLIAHFKFIRRDTGV